MYIVLADNQNGTWSVQVRGFQRLVTFDAEDTLVSIVGFGEDFHALKNAAARLEKHLRRKRFGRVTLPFCLDTHVGFLVASYRGPDALSYHGRILSGVTRICMPWTETLVGVSIGNEEAVKASLETALASPFQVMHRAKTYLC